VYDIFMKYVFLAIFVLLAAQPVQVSSCDMHKAQETTQDGSHDMNHDGGMGMDCCDPDSSAPSDSCDSVSHCGASTAGAVAFNSYTFNVVFNTTSGQFLPDTGGPLNRFSSPPFRPPIS
jgi:hypothetical protein